VADFVGTNLDAVLDEQASGGATCGQFSLFVI